MRLESNNEPESHTLVNLANDEESVNAETNKPMRELIREFLNSSRIKLSNMRNLWPEYEFVKEASELKVGEKKVGEKNQKFNNNKIIIPYDKYRVIIRKLINKDELVEHKSDSPLEAAKMKKQAKKDAKMPYINASWVKGVDDMKRYIAAQGPMVKTVDRFWQMIWELRITKIVTLENCIQGNASFYHQYWPNLLTEELKFNDIKVTLKSQIFHNVYTERTLEARVKKESLIIKQIHFRLWSKLTNPECSLFHSFFDAIYKDPLFGIFNKDITLVHCADGGYKTAIYITLHRILQLLPHINVPQQLEEVIISRTNMIYDPVHLHFLYEYLTYFMRTKFLPNIDHIIQWQQSISPSPNADKSPAKSQALIEQTNVDDIGDTGDDNTGEDNDDDNDIEETNDYDEQIGLKQKVSEDKNEDDQENDDDEEKENEGQEDDDVREEENEDQEDDDVREEENEGQEDDDVREEENEGQEDDGGREEENEDQEDDDGKEVEFKDQEDDDDEEEDNEDRESEKSEGQVGVQRGLRAKGQDMMNKRRVEGEKEKADSRAVVSDDSDTDSGRDSRVSSKISHKNGSDYNSNEESDILSDTDDTANISSLVQANRTKDGHDQEEIEEEDSSQQEQGVESQEEDERKQAEEAEKQKEIQRKQREQAEKQRKEEERKQLAEAEKKRKQQEEADRKKKLQEEADRIKKQQEEADRKKKQQEEADRIKKQQEEADRKKKLQEEADRKKKQQEEADRIKKLQEEADRKKKQQEEADRKKKQQEEADRKKKQQEELDRKRKVAESKMKLMEQKEKSDEWKKAISDEKWRNQLEDWNRFLIFWKARLFDKIKLENK